MIDDLLAPAALESSRRLSTPPFITWGEYGRILEGYYAIFPREQIFVCFTRDLEESPRELMRELLDFLGIDRTSCHRAWKPATGREQPPRWSAGGPGPAEEADASARGPLVLAAPSVRAPAGA